MSTVRLCAGCVFDHAHLESEMDGTCMKMLRVYGALSADPCHCRYYHAQSLLPLHFPIHPITCFLYTCRSFLCVLYIPKEIVEYVKKYTCIIYIYIIGSDCKYQEKCLEFNEIGLFSFQT